MATKADLLDRTVTLRKCDSCPREEELANANFHEDGHGKLRYKCRWCRAQKNKGRAEGRVQGINRAKQFLDKEFPFILPLIEQFRPNFWKDLEAWATR